MQENGLIRKPRLISKFMTLQIGKQAITVHISLKGTVTQIYNSKYMIASTHFRIHSYSSC